MESPPAWFLVSWAAVGVFFAYLFGHFNGWQAGSVWGQKNPPDSFRKEGYNAGRIAGREAGFRDGFKSGQLAAMDAIRDSIAETEEGED